MTQSRGVEVAETLEEKAARLRRKIDREDAERAELAAAEKEIAAKKRAETLAAVRADAEKRLLDIKKIVGSLAASGEQDDVRVLQNAQAFARAMQQLDDRFVKYVKLVDEAKRLAAAVGLPTPALSVMPLPRTRKAIHEAQALVYDVPVRDTAFGVGLDDVIGEFEKSDSGEIVARLRAAQE